VKTIVIQAAVEERNMQKRRDEPAEFNFELIGRHDSERDLDTTSAIEVTGVDDSDSCRGMLIFTQ
jgi:hypothetical protein